MKKITIIAVIVSCTLISCKKDRICECKNSNGTYDAGEVTATKMQAKKLCKDLSTSSTQCYLK
ncbi:MAG: hypothetical protein H0W61_10400 [Bacteroidetes bacterium]|nr:hypothetical protein [Bacteroidota bacterium]